MEHTEFECKVVVIGAGVSGLSAANTLIESGFSNITVIEAGDEVGGRVHTINQGLFSFETGAKWMYGNISNPMWKFIEMHGIQVSINSRFEKSIYFIEDSKPLSQEDEHMVKKGIQQFEDILKNVGNPNLNKKQSVLSYVKEGWDKYCTGFCKSNLKILDYVFSYMNTQCCLLDGCDSLNDLPLSAYTDYQIIPGQTMTFKDGYQSLAQEIQKCIPTESVHLNCEVTCVEWSHTGPHPVKVKYCTEGKAKQVQADHVIVTLPLGCLKEKHHSLFKPLLPQHKINAIQRIGFGLVNKVILYYDQPFWNEDVDQICILWGDDKLDEKMNNWQRAIKQFNVIRDKKNNQQFLVGWIAGEKAKLIESLSEIEIGNGCHETFLKFTGKRDIHGPSYVYVTRWHSNKYAKGSYSFTSQPSNEQDRITLAEPLILPAAKKPLQLLFAGEATHESYYSTVHGAFLSGKREAERIIQHYKSAEK